MKNVYPYHVFVDCTDCNIFVFLDRYWFFNVFVRQRYTKIPRKNFNILLCNLKLMFLSCTRFSHISFIKFSIPFCWLPIVEDGMPVPCAIPGWAPTWGTSGFVTCAPSWTPTRWQWFSPYQFSQFFLIPLLCESVFFPRFFIDKWSW